MSLFNVGAFMLHSGSTSPFLIDCEALVDEDWEALALIIAMSGHPPSFSRVEGVPRGGLRLAAALERHCFPGRRSAPLLIVDDVLTTGASMEQQRNGRDAVGWVVFARGPCPPWVHAIFTTEVLR